MAQSIALHFSSARWEEISRTLSEMATPSKGGDGELWLYPPNAENDVTAYKYNDILSEYEDVDLKRLIERLGSRPSATLCIELRGSRGEAAVNSAAKLATLLLKKFQGVVDDLGTVSEIWTLAEIEQHVQKDGRRFLDCYRKESRNM